MNAEYIQEPERTLPVRYADYDVIVAGGGIAGIGEFLVATFALALVQALEIAAQHQHFAAHFQFRRPAGAG